MDQTTAPWRDPTVMCEVLRFETAEVATKPGSAVSTRPLRIRYLVHEISRSESQELAGDPTDIAPVSVLKLALNVVATFVLVLFAGLGLAASAPALLGYDPVVVVSGSMEPTIMVADVVLTRPSDGVDLASGTVINYEYEDDTRLHRIESTTENGYRTAGDANMTSDAEVVTPSQVRGVGTVVVPFVGVPALWFERGQWLYLVGAVLVIAGAIYASRIPLADFRSKSI